MGSVEKIVTNWWILTKIICIWMKFGFQLPKALVLEVFQKHCRCSGNNSLQAICIWLRIHFSWQWLMHRLPSTIIFPKMLHLKCQFLNLTEIYIILLFTNVHALFNNKSMLILNLRYTLSHRLHIHHNKCWLCRHSTPGRWCWKVIFLNSTHVSCFMFLWQAGQCIL